MVMIDSGAELSGYAGDITRTLPVNGQFSEAQKTVYNIVLEAQLAAIDAVKPGNHWNDPHEAAVKILTKGLRDIGVLKGKLPQHLKESSLNELTRLSTIFSQAATGTPAPSHDPGLVVFN